MFPKLFCLPLNREWDISFQTFYANDESVSTKIYICHSMNGWQNINFAYISKREGKYFNYAHFTHAGQSWNILVAGQWSPSWIAVTLPRNICPCYTLLRTYKRIRRYIWIYNHYVSHENCAMLYIFSRVPILLFLNWSTGSPGSIIRSNLRMYWRVLIIR